MTAPTSDRRASGGTERSVVRVVLGLPRPVKTLIFGIFFNRFGSFFSAFLVLFLKDEGFSPQAMPLVLVAVGVVTPIGSVVGGWAADRFSRKATMITSTLIAAGGLLLMGLVDGKGAVVVGVVVVALFAQAAQPAEWAFVVDHVAEEDRVPTFALFRLALNVGAALGPLVAVALADRDLASLFVIDGVTFIAFAALMSATLPREHRAAGAAGIESAELSDRSAASGSGVHVLGFYAGVLGILAVYGQFMSSLPLSMLDHGMTRSWYSAMLMVNGALVVGLELPLSSVTRRLPWRRPMLLGVMSMAVGITIAGGSGLGALIVFGVVLCTFGEMLFAPLINTAVASFSPPDRIGRYQGYLSTTQAVGFTAGPAVGVWLLDQNPGLLWVSCTAIGALSCLGIGRASTLSPSQGGSA